MSSTINLIERAFELARSGRLAKMQDLLRALKDERLDNVEAHLAGPGTRKELMKLMTAARGKDRAA